MKKHLLALSLLATSNLIGQDTLPTSECCTPCAPCKMDCTCYPPAYYDLQCDSGVAIDVEFLYWFVRETNLPYAATVTVVSRNSNVAGVSNLALIQDLKFLDTKWDPGFRIGLDWNTHCNGWDVYLDWTYFKNESSKSTSKKFAGLEPTLGESGVVNPWVNPTAQNIQPIQVDLPLFEKVSAKWKLLFNQVDLVIGNKYWLNSCFSIRPYAGLRGIWTSTHFKTTGSQGPKTVTSPFTITNFENTSLNTWKSNQWAVCLLAGFQPNWYFCNNFILYADLDIALGWGNIHQRAKERYFIGGIGVSNPTVTGPFVIIDQSNSYKERFSNMATLLDLGLGLRWEETWCCNRYRTSFDLGWENHIWYDTANRVITFGSDIESSTQTFTGFVDNIGNLLYGGLVARFRFDF